MEHGLGGRIDVVNGGVIPITDKDKPIPPYMWDPHYTDRRFTESRTEGLTIFKSPDVVFVADRLCGEIGEGLDYIYSDRLHLSVDHDTWRTAWDDVAQELGSEKSRTARFTEHFLRKVLKNDTLSLGHIKAGVNNSNGYSYKIYGVNFSDPIEGETIEDTDLSKPIPRERYMPLEQAMGLFSMQLQLFPELLAEVTTLSGGSIGVVNAIMETMGDSISYNPMTEITVHRVREVLNVPSDSTQLEEWRAQFWQSYKDKKVTDSEE
jgi:hypothetical protein